MAEIAESVPEGIPQDVWAAADEALDLMLCNCIESSGSAEQFRIDSTEPIARAILAEREACVRRYRDGAGPNSYDYFEEAENAINPKH